MKNSGGLERFTYIDLFIFALEQGGSVW